MPIINNYSFSDAVYSIPENASIPGEIGTATITISPLSGYTATAGDFSLDPSFSNEYVDSVTFTQSGSDVICTIIFLTGAIMPSANVTIPLCVIGSAEILPIPISGTITAFVGTNINGDSSETNTPYSSDGAYDSNELLFSRTYNADSGYYFSSTPSCNITIGNQSNYNIVQTPTYNIDGQLTSITFDVNYIYPSYSVSGDKVSLQVPSAEQIFIKPEYITGYSYFDTTVSGYGNTFYYTVYGQENAEFSVDVVALNGANFSPATNIIMPADGVYIVEITYPSIIGQSYSSEQYTVTISGDLDPAFNLPTSIIVYQSRRTTELTFTASTTGSITGWTPVKTSAAALTDLQRNPRIVNIEWQLTSPNTIIPYSSLNTNILENSYNIFINTTAASLNSNVITISDSSDLLVGDKFNLYDSSGRGVYKYEITAINSSTEIEVSPNITVASGALISVWRNNGNFVELQDFNISINSDTNIATLTASINVEYFGENDATFTLLLDDLLQEIPTVACSGTASNGGQGVTDHIIELDPAGGLIAFLVNAQTVSDKFEIIHGVPETSYFIKQATSSMSAGNTSGPFDNAYGTSPTNIIPTTAQTATLDQFIGLAAGTIPTKQSEFNAETGYTVSSMTVGVTTYQQIVWWEYTASDYNNNSKASLRVTGPSGTGWNILRLCCPDANCT